MGNETTHPMIYGKMIAIMREVEPVGKAQQNKAQNYAFRGIDDIYNALHNLMGKHGVFCLTQVMPDTLIREQHPTKNGGSQFLTIQDFKFTFYAEDGSNVEAITKGEAMDFGDKSCNKAMSAAHKYALVQAFMLETKENMDTEHQSPEVPYRAPEPLATQAELDEYEAIRQTAIDAGFLIKGSEPKPATPNIPRDKILKGIAVMHKWLETNTPEPSTTEPTGDDGSAATEPNLCDAGLYHKRYFAIAGDTEYKDADARAAFIKGFTNGKTESLSEFLKSATEIDARKMCKALQDRITAEAGEFDDSDPFASEDDDTALPLETAAGTNTAHA